MKVEIRLEQLPLLKSKIEDALNNLMSLAEKPIEEINWEVSVDIGERKLNVEITPQYNELPDLNKFGVTGERGSDSLIIRTDFARSESESKELLLETDT